MSSLVQRLTMRTKRLFGLSKKKHHHINTGASLSMHEEKKISLFPRMSHHGFVHIPRQHHRHVKNKYKLPLSIMVGGVLLLVIVFGYKIRADVTKVNFYASTCAGGWEHPEYASGVAQVFEGGQTFSKENSAFLANSTGEITCADFKGDIPLDATPQKIVVKMSWLLTDDALPDKEPFNTIPEVEGGETHEISDTDTEATPSSEVPPSESSSDEVLQDTTEQKESPQETLPGPDASETPVEEQNPTPPDGAVQTFLWNSFKPQVVYAEDTPVESVVQEEVVSDIPLEVTEEIVPSDTAEQGDIVPVPGGEESVSEVAVADDFLEVSYSLDELTWKKIGTVGGAHWEDATFQIDDPAIIQSGDISNIKIKIATLATIDTPPVVYLDSAYIEVEYEIAPPVIAPTIALTDASSMIFGVTDFSAQDAPTFTVRDPALSAIEIAGLIEKGDAKVIEDTEGVFAELLNKPDAPMFIPAIPDVLEEMLPKAPLPADSSGETIPLEEDILIPDEIPIVPIAPDDAAPAPESKSSDIISLLHQTITKKIPTIATTEIVVPDAPRPRYTTITHKKTPSFFVTKKAFAEDVIVPPTQAVVLDADGELTDIVATVSTNITDGVPQQEVSIERPSRSFRPGTYILRVSMTTPDAIIVSEQDFTWGVLAINTDKSLYKPGDTAYLQMGVLTDQGHTVCDADLTLAITTPSGAVTQLDTRDGSIVREEMCGPDNVINVPDYYGYYRVGGVGTYTMTLTATTGNGTKTIQDSFVVSAAFPFIVSRTGPTRIYPVVAYAMSINVSSDDAWSGTVTERVPASFEIISSDVGLPYDNIEREGDTKIISWNVSLLAGQEVTLGYYFNAPDISPEFYLLGKIKLTDTNSAISFEEFRNWQIASDAACSSQSGGGNWSDTSKWSCGHEPTTADAVTIVSGSDMTVNVGTQAVTSVTINNGATLYGGSNTLTIGTTSGTAFTNNGTFNAGTGTVTFSGAAAITLLSGTFTGSSAFYNLQMTPAISTTSRTYTAGTAFNVGNNLTVNPSSASVRSLTLTLSGTTTITGTLTVTGTTSATGTLDTASGSNYALSFNNIVIGTGSTTTIRGSLVTVTGTSGTLISNSGTWTAPITPSTVTLSGNGDATVLSGTTATFFNLTSSGTGTKTLGVAMTVSNVFTISGGTFAASSYAITLSGTTGTPFVNSATFSAGTGTVTYTGNNTGGNTTVLSATYYNVTVNAAETFVLGGAIVANVAGKVLITNGTLDTVSGSSYAITAGFLEVANLSTAIFTPNASVITLNGTSGTLFTKGANGVYNVGTAEFVVTSASGTPIFSSRSLSYHKITINADATIINSGAAITMSSTDASNKFYVQKGVFNAAEYGVTGTANGTFQVDAGAGFCVIGTIASTNATCNSAAGNTNIAAVFPANYTNANITLAATSTIYYNNNRNTVLSPTPTYGNVTVAPVMTASRTATFSAGAVTINGNLTVNPSGGGVAYSNTVTYGSAGLTVVGAVTLSGTSSGYSILDTGSALNYPLTAGSVSIAASSSLLIRNSTFTITGTSGTLLANAGTFTAGGTSTTVFSGNGSATINSGALDFNTLTFSGTGTKTLGAAISVSSSKTMTVSAGTFDPSTYLVTGSGTNTLTVSNATIAVGASTFAGSYSAGFGTVNLNAGSTVDYNLGGTQTVDSSKTYVNLTISTSGTKSLNATTTVTGTLTVNGGTLDTVNGSGYTVTTVGLTIGASGTFRARTSAVTVTGSWTNAGTFTADTSTVTFNGGTTATISGTTSFYNLTITHSAAKEVNFASSGAPVYTITNTFTATGHAAALIKLYSDATPTAWHFHPTGTASADYVDVKDSTCDSGSVTVDPLTNFTNSGNNGSCWGTVVPTITFSNSDDTIGFGPLTSGAVRYATGDTSGSSSDSVAHSFVVTTNATNGYTLTYKGPTLTSGANTIAVGTALATGGTPGTAQFGISGALTGSDTGAMATNYNHATPKWTYVDNTTTTLASSTGAVTSDTINMHYQSNISSVTPAGSYQTMITYILTGNF